MQRFLGSLLFVLAGITASAAPAAPTVIRSIKIDRQSLNVAALRWGMCETRH